MTTENEHQFFRSWWQTFGDAPTNVSLLLSTGPDELRQAAAAIAPGPTHLGPISPIKLGRWLNRRSSACIPLDDILTLSLIPIQSSMPGLFWRLKMQEKQEAA